MIRTDHKRQPPLSLLSHDATIYRITTDELMAYDPTIKNKRRVFTLRQNHKDELLMVMFPEGASAEQILSITHAVDQVRHKVRAISSLKVEGLRDRPYLLIKEPEVIARIKELASDKIRSFKDDLFPDSDIKPLPAHDRDSWQR